MKRSIKKQVSMTVVATCIASALLTIVIFLSYRYYKDRKDLIEHSQQQVEIINQLVERETPEQAYIILSTMAKRTEHIEVAAIYRGTTLFAKYPADAEVPLILKTISDPYGFYGNKLYVSVVNQHPLGETHIVLNLDAFYQEMRITIIALMIISGIAVGIASIFAFRMTQSIIAPLKELVRLTRHIRKNQDYSIRSTNVAHDEVGVLADSINNLLSQIQERDQALLDKNADLENQVKERTEELREAVVKAEYASHAKSAFLANMSHELRTPLTAIQMYTELVIEDLMDGSGTPEIHTQDLNNVITSSQHLLSLIEDVLDLAKIEAGKTDLLLEKVSIQTLLADVMMQANPLMVQNENQFILESDVPKKFTLGTDRKRISQILLNLLSNSAKFTSMGTVTLKAMADIDSLVFQVEDNGIGMTQEQTERVWEGFEQADSSTSKKYGGSGLGLALSKKLVKLLGGKISMTSSPGVGTTVTLQLPLVR